MAASMAGNHLPIPIPVQWCVFICGSVKGDECLMEGRVFELRSTCPCVLRLRFPAPTLQPQQPAAPGTQRPSTAGATPPAAQELTQTATIRNAVNLKKSTLSVQAAPGAPGKLSVSFSFDASAPAAVTVFFGAREDLQRGCQLTAAVPPAAPLLYPKGLGLAYPPAPGAGTTLDLAALPESTLLGETPDVYALAVRLETVTEAGAAEGRRLEELQPGAPQPAWVQSQTTFAYLHREEEGVYAVRVCKQKIWVEGVSYELQEIYGLEQSGMIPAAPGTADDSEERLCVICLVNDRDTTVLPCRHMCMCHECAQELRKQTSKCPICRNHVESLLHIKMSKGARKAAASAAGAAAV